VPDEEKSLNEAAVAILFSVNDYSANITENERKIINDFFEQLKLETENP